ncbi:hypothetical protein [Microvirga sp. BSC39]|uniref:hypothetical protein n=1 Tax=Microvirga sp. BSC39 TaxID=1549810 RepID=UPI001269BAD4|nr:hypothetical protein [Microvirga sp. BSC39]
MKTKIFIAVFAAVGLGVLPVVALAQPTYLACVLDGGSVGPVRINFTTDESAGTVSIHIVSSGHSRTVNAAFTPDRVLVDERTVRWMIDRTNLQFSRTIKSVNGTEYGQCEIQKPPQRAF